MLLPTVTESLAGRMEIVQLQPLTEAEKEGKRGRFLIALLEGALKPSIRPGTTTAGPTLAERLVAGGYPEPLTRPPVRARQWHRQYLRGIIERDVREVARVKDARELARMLELLALTQRTTVQCQQFGKRPWHSPGDRGALCHRARTPLPGAAFARLAPQHS